MKKKNDIKFSIYFSSEPKILYYFTSTEHTYLMRIREIWL